MPPDWTAFEQDLLFTMSDNTCALRRSGNGTNSSFLTDGGSTPRKTKWWSQTGSNRRPPACKAGALPTELWPRLRTFHTPFDRKVVGPGRLELPTSRLSGVRSNHLSYGPRFPRSWGVPERQVTARSRVARSRVERVREERETKTAVSRQNGP